MNNKITEASNFLEELNKKLQNRDQEIDSLKQAITNSRSENSKTEVERALMPESVRQNINRLPCVTMHDFPPIES